MIFFANECPYFWLRTCHVTVTEGMGAGGSVTKSAVEGIKAASEADLAASLSSRAAQESTKGT